MSHSFVGIGLIPDSSNVVPWCSWREGTTLCVSFHISVRRDRAYQYCVDMAKEMGLPFYAVSLLDRWVFNGRAYYVQIEKAYEKRIKVHGYPGSRRVALGLTLPT